MYFKKEINRRFAIHMHAKSCMLWLMHVVAAAAQAAELCASDVPGPELEFEFCGFCLGLSSWGSSSPVGDGGEGEEEGEAPDCHGLMDATLFLVLVLRGFPQARSKVASPCGPRAVEAQASLMCLGSDWSGAPEN